MFNDLIVELDNKEIKVFAYADDLANIGYGLPKLKKAIKIIEN